MPLLKRKAFEKSTASEYLRDDDEVFHCEVTDEIFKDYEEYCERIILVNSMVWSCEMTGKNNLTYAEALESEKAARRSLKDFPMELRTPILFLATKTKRCSFAEMSEDIFNYVRERYFVGETVEACLENDIWKEAYVLSVTAQKQQPDSQALLPATSYYYEVEQFHESDPSASDVGMVPHDHIRRRKGIYSRDKNRLFLKQFVEQGPDTIICIKKVALEKYNIMKINYDQLFTGDPPDFPSSKKLMKSSLSPSVSRAQLKPGSASKLNKSVKKNTPDKKGKQESMDKFVKKTDKSQAPKTKPPTDPAAKKSAQELAEKMRQAEDLLKQKKEDEKAKKKEKNARLQAYLKEWQKVKDDLELEDHKAIPIGTPIEIEGLSHKHFGDFLTVLEFVHTYADTLHVKDVFHNELDIETFRKALTLKEHAGTFSDLVQMFLTTIFSLQEDEAEAYNESGGIQLSTVVDDKLMEGDSGINKAVEFATKASKWSQTYLGTPLSKLPLDPTTVTEVLRLHFLSSGAMAGSRCATWRYQQRGGYSSADDPALQLRLRRPHLLRALAASHVAELSLDDKFLVLQCLMNQVLSYATIRDIIEEKIEDYKNKKHALRLLQVNERKRDVQLSAARQDLKKEYAAKKEELKLTGDNAKQHDEELRVAVEKLVKEGELKRQEHEKKAKEMQAELFEYVTYIGSDRAYRRYWVNQKVSGLFVEAGVDNLGPCRDKPVPLAPPREGDTLAYVAKLFESQRETAGSDKENDSGANSRGNSPKKPFLALNGLTQKLNGLESNTQQFRDLLVCTGDITTCLVHGKSDFRPSWWVYNTEEQIDGLIQSLNKRGIREGELKQALELDRNNIVQNIKKCPIHLLNVNFSQPTMPLPMTRHRKFQPSLTIPDDCGVSETLELSLRDHILELEEKIFHGCLGSVKVKDREAWRGTIMLRGYDKQAKYLTWGPNQQYRDDYHMPNGVLNLPNDVDNSENTTILANNYRDPGYYLGMPKINGVKLEPEDSGGRGTKPEVVRGLASALLQVSQGIHHKYLRRPLGLDDKERKEREAKNKPLELEALARWEVSLMECCSISQIVLHLLTFDSSVTWSASILNASCRLCRRKTDPDNMLLCDGCNKGHHLYCLKPKLHRVPDGDWFCDQCKPKEEKAPRKRRRVFVEEVKDESSEDESEDCEQAEEESDSEEVDVCGGVCGSCGSGGRLARACVTCGARYHAECAPLKGRRANLWTCADCNRGDVREHGVRRCAANAINNIHQYAKALNSRRNSSESYDSEDNMALGKLKNRKSRGSKEPSPHLNGSMNNKRKRKSTARDDFDTSSGRKKKSSLTNGVHEESKPKANTKKRVSKVEPALRRVVLDQLLKDVMRHKDCWPFYEAVSIQDVPDYLDIIDQPMDFTTIKHKLEAGEYSADRELIDDAALVLANCFTYNQDTHPVAKAGVRLEKYINKRCGELELPALPEVIPEDSEFKRIRSASEESESSAKRPRIK